MAIQRCVHNVHFDLSYVQDAAPEAAAKIKEEKVVSRFHRNTETYGTLLVVILYTKSICENS
jgi:hypothetical protein